jgi:hypothetical protein
MRINRNGVSQFNSFDQVTMLVAENCCGAVGAIDMQPEVIFFRDVR